MTTSPVYSSSLAKTVSSSLREKPEIKNFLSVSDSCSMGRDVLCRTFYLLAGGYNGLIALIQLKTNLINKCYSLFCSLIGQ